MDPQDEIYMVQVKVSMLGQPGSSSLGAAFRKIAECLKSCEYRFKVVGEPLIIAVCYVSCYNQVESMLQNLSRVGQLDVQCDPLVTYEGFARRLGADEDLTKPSPRNMNVDRCLWARVDIEYPGMTLDELISYWKPEAEAVLGARKEGKKIEVLKMAGQRKILSCNISLESFEGDDSIEIMQGRIPCLVTIVELHVFTASSAEEWDALSFTLPQMKTMGNCITIVTKSLVNFKR